MLDKRRYRNCFIAQLSERQDLFGPGKGEEAIPAAAPGSIIWGRIAVEL